MSGPRRSHWRVRSPATSSLLGRELELVTIADAFRTGSHMVTLLGPGGVGKTSLARAFAETWADEGADAWFCDASAARTSADLVAAVGRVLDVRVVEGEGTDALERRIGEYMGRRMSPLLVIDNFEQLAEGAARVVDGWRAAAPSSAFLLTSRRPTTTGGERVVRIEPLPLAAAEELFRARSTHRLHGQLDPERDGAQVAELVRRLEGIPLAIELAAARLDVLPIDTLVRRLAERFELLRDPLASGERHSTLWRTIDWSWALLEPWQADALARLSVFESAFDLEAAGEVLGLPARDDAPTALDAVHALIRHSLLHPDGVGRFALFESVREFAAKKLEDARGREARAAHARHFGALCRAAVDALETRGDADALRRLEAYRDDLLAVLRRALALAPPTAASASDAAATTLALGPLLLLREASTTQLELLDATLAAVRAAGTPREEARLEIARATVLRRLGRFAEALAAADAARARARAGGAPRLEAAALREAARARIAIGEPELARRLAGEAVELARAAGDARGEGLALVQRSSAAGELAAFDDARADGERALALLHAVGANARDEADALTALGAAAFERGDTDAARASFERCAAIYAETGDRREEAAARGYLGGVRHERDDFAGAREAYEQAWRAFAEVADRRLEAVYLGYVGIVDMQRGDVEGGGARIAEARGALAEMGDRHFELVMAAALAGVRALRGDPGGAAVELVAIERAAAKLENASLAQVVDVYRGVLEAARGDVAAARRREKELARAPTEDVRLSLPLLRRVAREAEARARAWSIDERGVSFCAPGRDEISLDRRSPLARILAALARHRIEHRGEVLGKAPLVAAGWPGAALPQAVANNRLKVAMSTLRKMGLEHLILTRDGGYLLDPDVPVVVEAAAEGSIGGA